LASDRPSFTAEWVAAIRAVEQTLPPGARVVDDPFAAPFLEHARSRLARGGLRGPLARGAAAVLAAPPFRFTQSVLVRHRVLDDLLLDEAKAGAAQLVVLGAGYDARAYRFPPGQGGPERVFEVDRPALSALKRRAVAAALGALPRHVRFVEVDFLRERVADRLVAEGFEPSLRSVFLWEGVTMYLTRAAILETLGALRAIAAPGSSIAFDVFRRPEGRDPISVAGRLAPEVVLRAIGEPLLCSFGEAGEQPLDLVRAAGWEPLFHKRSEDLQAAFERLAPGRGRVSPQIELVAARATEGGTKRG
jgi:methyltransferase (TIGR00027 family)